MKCVFPYALFAVLLGVATSDGDIRQVNLVYRHGDRSPIDIFPTDTHKIDTWPQGLGWLTQIGMEQQYELGQWLRKRYVTAAKFMNADYKRVELTVHSSDENRCLMSAYCNLAGLYPPAGNTSFHPNLPWQPIPVHTEPSETDNMLKMGANCPRYNQLLHETFTSESVQKEERDNKAFYKMIEEKTGWTGMNISTIWQIADTLVCENKHNLSRPSWVNNTVYNKLIDLDSLQMSLLYQGQQMSRLKGGPLLNQFIQNMEAYTPAAPKMYMYSGHDTTVAALLSALDLYPGPSPEYASCVLVELHQDPTGKFFVNIFYKNETYNDSAVPLVLKGCSFNCPLDDFVRLTKPVVPVDWDQECGNNPSGSKSGLLSTAWIVAIVLGIVLMIVVVTTLVCLIRIKKRNSTDFLYGKFDVTA